MVQFAGFHRITFLFRTALLVRLDEPNALITRLFSDGSSLTHSTDIPSFRAFIIAKHRVHHSVPARQIPVVDPADDDA